MLIIWKDNTKQEAIFYRDDHISDQKLVTTQQVEELMKEPLVEGEYLVTAFHLPSFDGPWPTQETLDYNKEHRYDFMKNMKLVWLDFSNEH